MSLLVRTCVGHARRTQVVWNGTTKLTGLKSSSLSLPSSLLSGSRHPFSQRFMKMQKFSNSSSSMVASMDNVVANRPIAYWLLGVAGVVAGMVSVGGITRLTRSGLSMVSWKPHGGLPPLTKEEWNEEFEKYKQFPEFQQRSSMSLEDFKDIFWWEYGHRMLGRFTGVCFGVPLIYFSLTKRLPRELYGRLGALLTLGAAQGGIGWWMVKSGLQKQQTNDFKEIRVSPYRLAVHLGMAFTTYSLLLWTAFDVLIPKSTLARTRDMLDPYVMKRSSILRKSLFMTATLLGITVASGAFVAGIDAGMAYNTFPKMDDQWIPDDLFPLEPKYRNFFETTSLVQLDHRLLAMSTLTGVLVTTALARNRRVWRQLPKETKLALNTMLGLTGVQVSLGIATLLTYVPVPLAATHQAGSLALLSSVLWTMHTLRYAKFKPFQQKNMPFSLFSSIK